MGLEPSKSTGAVQGVYVPPPEVAPLIDTARELLQVVPGLSNSFLMYDADRLTARYNLRQQHLGMPPHFAVKACSNMGVLHILHQLGSHFDAATGGELVLLEKLGVDPSKVLVTRPVRDERDLEVINRYKPRALVVQDIDDVRDLIEAGIPRPDYQPELLLRAALPLPGLGTKFGFEVSRPVMRDGQPRTQLEVRKVLEFFKAVRELEDGASTRFAAYGMSTHVGTNTCKTAPYQAFVQQIFQPLREQLKKAGFELSICDLGGGYPDPETAIQNGTTQAELVQKLGRVIDGYRENMPGVTFADEPGRFMVADQGTIVTQVMRASPMDFLYRKGQAGEVHAEGVAHLRMLIRDSIYKNLMRVWHDDAILKLYPFLRDTSHGTLSARMIPALVNGETCDSVDQLDEMPRFPENLPGFNRSRGCHILIPSQGAYAKETATNFNAIVQSQTVIYSRDSDGKLSWILFDEKGEQTGSSSQPLRFGALPRA